MFLKILKIKKFRSIDEIEICFNKGLNIIIGENNSGKTAIIDALRICLGFGKQWKDIGIRNDEDFFIDVKNVDCLASPIEFDLHFEVETSEDAQYFNSMLWQNPQDARQQEIQMHFRYSLEPTLSGTPRLKWTSWGGAMEGQAIDSNEAQLLYYTYLAPLRNAEQELRPYAKDNKISSLFRDLTSYKITDAAGDVSDKSLDNAEKINLASKLESVINGDDWKGLITTGTNYVNEHLEKADIKSKKSNVHLRLIEYKYDNIVKGIITRKSVFEQALLPAGEEHKQRYFDVSQNGLGENNLVFASAVLGDLKNRRSEKKEQYYSLLIEEPEAHLHPQRQNTFFNYLNNLQDLGLQIFITSHSPTLTAKSNLDDLIIIQQQIGIKNPFTIKNSDLSGDNKLHLSKFLDVTKSQLFFSNGTILVEGISEALLLPILALMFDSRYHLDENGVEIVNINGVAFEPFARLYNSNDVKKRLSSRCAILTDDDRGNLSANNFINAASGINKTTANEIFQHLQLDNVVDGSNRIINEAGYEFNHENLNQHSVFINDIINTRRTQVSPRATNAAALTNANLRSEFAVYTFEYELMMASEVNYRLMMSIYLTMHPQTSFLPKTDPIKSRTLEFVAKLDSNKDKSGFAEKLALVLENRIGKSSHFIIPNYIKRAITWVIDAV